MGASPSAQSPSTPTVDVVLDLDHTLVVTDFSLTHAQQHAETERESEIVTVRNPRFAAPIPFRLAPHALAFLRVLLERESAGELRVSFFSTGHAWRNEQLVPLLVERAWAMPCRDRKNDNNDCRDENSIVDERRKDTDTHSGTDKLQDNPMHTDTHTDTHTDKHTDTHTNTHAKTRTNTQRNNDKGTDTHTASNNGPKTFSFPSLLSAKHRRRHRQHKVLSKEDLDGAGMKELTRVHRDLSLERAVLVDDWPNAAAGQRENLLQLSKGLGAHPSTLSEEENKRVRENLARALGVIVRAISLASSSSEGLSFREAMQRVLREETSSSSAAEDIVRIGFHEMKSFGLFPH